MTVNRLSIPPDASGEYLDSLAGLYGIARVKGEDDNHFREYLRETYNELRLEDAVKALKPCPFCGSQPVILQRAYPTRKADSLASYCIYCPGCETWHGFLEYSGGGFIDSFDAANSWNLRSDNHHAGRY